MTPWCVSSIADWTYLQLSDLQLVKDARYEGRCDAGPEDEMQADIARHSSCTRLQLERGDFEALAGIGVVNPGVFGL